jgi:hypothetical protein
MPPGGFAFPGHGSSPVTTERTVTVRGGCRGQDPHQWRNAEAKAQATYRAQRMGSAAQLSHTTSPGRAVAEELIWGSRWRSLAL